MGCACGLEVAVSISAFATAITGTLRKAAATQGYCSRRHPKANSMAKAAATNPSQWPLRISYLA